MSHPIEYNLATSPDGKHIAWVINDHGKRNILAKSGTDLPRLLTEYQLDDGQELSNLTFSPNGTKLLYVRGSGGNRVGQNPNPASLPEGAEQATTIKSFHLKIRQQKLQPVPILYFLKMVSGSSSAEAASYSNRH